MALARVCLPNTEVRDLKSLYNGENYRLSIALPENYHSSTDLYPVLYVLDEPLLFAMCVQIVRTLRIFAEIPELVLVGVGYPTELQADWLALRMRDYTPSRDDEFVHRFPEDFGLPLQPLETSSGGAEALLDFLESTCLPFVEGEYRVDKQVRMLAGWSFGGLFSLYALFTRPAVFNRFLVTSPSIWWGGAVLWSYEEQFSRDSSGPQLRLYLSMGSEERKESIRNVQKLTKRLLERADPGIQIKSEA